MQQLYLSEYSNYKYFLMSYSKLFVNSFCRIKYNEMKDNFLILYTVLKEIITGGVFFRLGRF